VIRRPCLLLDAECSLHELVGAPGLSSLLEERGELPVGGNRVPRRWALLEELDGQLVELDRALGLFHSGHRLGKEEVGASCFESGYRRAFA
jgi:hypothetical protein